jgi:hypothetical protein
MMRMVDLLRQNRKEELWHMCCGFLDLGMEGFMNIQRRLMLEQLDLLNGCELGKRIMKGSVPQTIEEFRRHAPLTTYADYCPDLLEKRDDILPEKPVLWQHTSGRTGEYGCKWIPLTGRFCDHLSKALLGVAILSGCKERNRITRLKERMKMVYAVAPRPYTSGTLLYVLQKEFPLRSLPPLEQSEAMSFESRVKEGFLQALECGLDGFCGLSLALVAVGEQFQASAQKASIKSLLSRPGALLRLTRGMLTSTLSGRPLLPRDLWKVKGIMSGGTDCAVLRERIKELWGRYPLDTYTCTEGCVIATQTWDYRDMSFVPDLNFLEFIPEKEVFREQRNNSYKPRTVLLDEVQPGEIYELVITNFHGGAMVRYRIGDMIKITALRNDELNIDIPQMAFERRADDLIDLAGYVRLTERTVWQAIENSGIPYEDWIVRKEIGEKPVAHIYLELKDGFHAGESDLEAVLYDEIKKLDERVNSSSIYSTLESMLGTIPLKVSLLPTGTFKDYTVRCKKEGADLAHVKPPHINPSDETLSQLGVERRTRGRVRYPLKAAPVHIR